MALKTTVFAATLFLVGITLMEPAAAEQWNFSDPQIAAASLGMLTPLMQPEFCPPHKIKEQRFVAALKIMTFSEGDVRKACEQCYLTGLEGAKTILDQTGKANYCASIVKMFGPTGTMVPDLIE